jgi:hypothetical protein
MRDIQVQRIPWLVFTVSMSLAWGALAQETTPPPSQAVAQSAIETVISFREAIFVLLLMVIIFAGLIGYEWVRKRA